MRAGRCDRFRWRMGGFIGVIGMLTFWGAHASQSAMGTAGGVSITGDLLDEGTMAALLAEVSEERIRAHVAHLVYKNPSLPYDPSIENLRTRFALRPETVQIATYVHDQLAAHLGPEAVQTIPFEAEVDDTFYTMYNVVGNLAGTDPSAGYYVITAHYDATARQTENWDWRTDPTSGADDNATGVALMLEAARVLSSLQFPWGIQFVGLSGEELHLLGSKEYVRQASERGDRILGAMNFDMIGYNRLVDRLHLVSNPASQWIVALMQAANERYGIGLTMDVVVDHRYLRSDHASFWFQGYDAILGIENYPPETTPDSTIYIPYAAYDSMVDVPDSINFGLVRKCTQLAVATLGQYATEEGLPDLAIFPEDVVFSERGELIITVSNLGLVDYHGGYDVRISRCAADSSACEGFYEAHRDSLIPRGGSEVFRIPFDPLGDASFLLELDPYDTIEEGSEANNALFAVLRNVPTDRIRVYPNPMRVDGVRQMTFAGLPSGTRVEVFGISGEPIWTGKERHREAFWKGTNKIGYLVGSGVYFYLVTQPDGGLVAKGKIAVVRE
ncbi:MAG: M28 family peptidase [Candidatus Latescibacterota bacterium]